MDDDMAGGPTRTLARSGSERRPSRRGVNTLLKTAPAWLEHFIRIEVTLWPTIRCDFFLRFRSKKTPPPIRPEGMLIASAMFRCCDRSYIEPQKRARRNTARG